MTKLLYLALCMFLFTSINLYCLESGSGMLQSHSRQKYELTPLQRRVFQGGGNAPSMSLKLEKKDARKQQLPSPLSRNTTLVAERSEAVMEDPIKKRGAIVGLVPFLSAMDRLKKDSTLPPNLGDRIPQKNSVVKTTS